MNPDAWLAALGVELRRRGVGPDLVGHVVAEAASHLRESVEPPTRVFGAPDAYAGAIADSLGGPQAAPPRPTGPVRLEVRGVSKSYRHRRVLSDVHLTVHSGQIAAIVGANGCGKSTLLGICAGMVGADRGEVVVHGSLGYCPQTGGTSGFLTADEHIVLIGTGRGLSRAQSRRAGARHAAELDWDSADPTQARRLSGGTRQKLNLVMAGIGRPDVLLLDEPYQGFDRGSYLDFWEQVWRWRDGGAAIVVVTHLLNQRDRVDTVLDLTPAGEAAA